MGIFNSYVSHYQRVTNQKLQDIEITSDPVSDNARLKIQHLA